MNKRGIDFSKLEERIISIENLRNWWGNSREEKEDPEKFNLLIDDINNNDDIRIIIKPADSDQGKFYSYQLSKRIEPFVKKFIKEHGFVEEYNDDDGAKLDF